MSSKILDSKDFDKLKPIPGYTTQELIGSGGNGEVWKAYAPGGLVKAVKFVYGDIKSKRAVRELRSLNRIKEVRHPFLLSIERIEIVDGNLIIVTELAESNLKDVFDKCREKDLAGIPRKQLLSYLLDAADALDYIYENYALQHLDIKPENLLLLGNRIKVADFGLIKNLYERSASLVDGLTPIYAPPEVFDGRPNRHSDQYSLAIVYQEMLTGVLPFDGESAARLAAQHLHEAPNLDCLPKSDQLCIARALSKDPDKRYSSCRDLVEKLVAATDQSPNGTDNDEPSAAAPKSAASPPSLSSQPLREHETIQLSVDLIDDPMSPASAGAHPIDECSQPEGEVCEGVFTELPAVDFDEADTVLSPTIFIGVGGTATRVLSRLKTRCYDRVGGRGEATIAQMLLMDTDVDSLNKSVQGEFGQALDGSEIVGIPLRNADEYRRRSPQLTESMSRRWFYNIPRNLRTNGFRPLGRLAWLDNAERIEDRIAELLRSATSTEQVNRCREKMGLNFTADNPRVVLVGSISGGTGSGILLDLAYQVRMILSEMNFSDENVHAVLFHSTPRGAKERDKATANAYAALKELSHYSMAGHCYPGDKGTGIPAFHGNNQTFQSSYLVNLGSDLTHSEWEAATDSVAEYLYCDAFTPAASFFEKCRQEDQKRRQENHLPPAIRTFGVCQLGGPDGHIPLAFADMLCRELVLQWRTGKTIDREEPTLKLSDPALLIEAHDSSLQLSHEEISAAVVDRMSELGLNFDTMLSEATKLLAQEIGGDIEGYLSTIVRQSFEVQNDESHQNENPSRVLRSIDILDSIIGLVHTVRQDETEADAGFDPLLTVLDTMQQSRAGQLASLVREWIFYFADNNAARLEGAKYAAECIQARLQNIVTASSVRAGELRDATIEVKQSILANVDGQPQSSKSARSASRNAKRRNEIQSLLVKYGQLSLQEAAVRSVQKWTRVTEGRVTALIDRLRVFWKDLNLLADQFGGSTNSILRHNSSREDRAAAEHWKVVTDRLMKSRPELSRHLEQLLEETQFDNDGKLRYLLTEDLDVRDTLADEMRTCARTLVLKAMQAINIDCFANKHADPAYGKIKQLQNSLDESVPYFFDDSAAKRLLLVVPKSDDRSQIERMFDEEIDLPLTIVEVPRGDIVACYEFEGQSTSAVARKLINDRDDFATLASQLHTRIDVEWTPMSNGEKQS